MSQNKNVNDRRDFKLFFFFFTICCLLVVGFNNCARQSSSSEEVAFQSFDNLQKDMALEMKGQYNENFCTRSLSYSCQQKIFSPEAENTSFFSEFPCVLVSGDVELCVTGTTYTYDSGRAIDKCENCDEESLEKRYQTEEYLCYHKGSIHNGLYAIRAEGKDLKSTVKQVYEVCMKVVRGEGIE